MYVCVCVCVHKIKILNKILYFLIVLTLQCYTRSVFRWNIVRHSALVVSSQSPSHSQGVGVLCSRSIVQYSHCFPWNSFRVSGPSDSGSRSTSGDTGEGELRAGSIATGSESRLNTISSSTCNISAE